MGAQSIKEKLINFFSYLSNYDLGLFAALLMLALCFIFLSFIAFKRKLLSIPLFFIGFLAALALPFGMRYVMENRFYKVEIEPSYDRVLNYSDVYQYRATITNIGSRNIKGCIISHKILYDVENVGAIDKYKHMIFNYAKPKKVFVKDIPMDLKVYQSVDIALQSQEFIDNYPYRNMPYKTDVECYGKERASKIEPLKGQYIKDFSKKDEVEETSDESSQAQDSTDSENIESNQSENANGDAAKEGENSANMTGQGNSMQEPTNPTSNENVGSSGDSAIKDSVNRQDSTNSKEPEIEEIPAFNNEPNIIDNTESSNNQSDVESMDSNSQNSNNLDFNNLDSKSEYERIMENMKLLKEAPR